MKAKTDLIDHNPLLKKPLLALLELAEQNPQGDRRGLEQAALEVWEDGYRQSPAVSVDILVRNGALTEQVYVDGEPYDGTMEDLQLDADVADDAAVESRVAVTDAGRQLLAQYAPSALLRSLFAEKPQYRDVFAAALRACAAEPGCSRADLEHTINEMPQLKPHPEAKPASVYPQYFIDALETCGGIAWNGSWHATEAGKAILTT